MVNPTSYNNIKHLGFELHNNAPSDFASNNNKHNKIITDFNTEGERVKLKLKNNLDNYTLLDPEEIKRFSSQKEESIINKNRYVKNIHSFKKLEKEISDLQYVELKINPLQSHSLRDFFSEVKISIICGKHDYLDVYKNIFSKYMDYVNDLRSTISILSQYTKSGSKSEYMNVQFSSFKEKLIEIKRKYENIDHGKCFFCSDLLFQYKENGSYLRKINDYSISYINKSQVNDAIITMEKSLKGIKGIKITKNEKSSGENQDIDITFVGSIDFSDINKFIESIDDSVSTVDGILSDSDLKEKREKLLKENTSLFGIVRPGFDIEAEMDKVIKENNIKKEEAKGRNILQNEFNLFKKSLDTLEKKINTNLDELSKKYSAANSNYDNFVKIVSSTMNTLLEMAKSFLRF
ncbi:IpaD/SipD/SspD family type III secretion system needle tip protein [Proteus cibi]|uniref:IpaD/SipD/SspD family type III secretion system needle tip protein n=1 Tax=Proteus cibi TaxID=2050966 RepID=UPI000D68C344|nr:IpaD/SipD/SspD family type III secretion system needle tip protein [Proteus cibi]MBS6208907.1 IpaD/SipD/SspD family type III secretion system needle tip protein [Proteus hauseri]